MEFTSKKLEELFQVSHVALSKALKDIDCEFKEVEGSAKKVKHYKLEDLPERYREKLKEQGFEIASTHKDTNISQAKFTKKYLLASPQKQKEAILKCRLVEFYIKKDSSLNTQQWLEQTLQNSLEFDDLGSISLKQLYDWYRKYREAKSKSLNVVEEFIDARGAKVGVKALSEEQQAVAVRYFLKTSRPRMSEIHRNMCHRFGDDMASYDTLNKFYKQWIKENPVLHEFSRSPDSAKNKFLISYGNESAKALYRNHYWELDSTPADVICDDGKRYTVLCAIDVFSRRAVFHITETSSAYAISQLLRKAILKFGIPENVIIDNGKDYTSNHFESICVNLNINAVIVPPFSGEKKPHVERMFGTLSRELFEQIPGYIGHNVAQRAELQARKSFAHKIASKEKWHREFSAKTDEEKKAFRDAWKIKKENLGLEIGVLTSADELMGWIDRWNEKLYEQREHSGLKKRKPIDVWNSNTMPVKGISDDRMLDLLLGESYIRRVGKKGIALDGCNYGHIELIEYIGKSVFVMTPSDLGYILVYNENMRFVCLAEDLQYMGQDRHKIKAARKKSAALMRQFDKIVKEAQTINDVTILDRIDAVSGETRADTTAVMKRTATIDRLLQDSSVIAEFDAGELEKSNRYDFTSKDKDGLPVKVLPSGRPAFNGFFERFLWALENDDWNDKDETLKHKHEAVYQLAYDEYVRRKSS
jgi:transposase InsO family protein